MCKNVCPRLASVNYNSLQCIFFFFSLAYSWSGIHASYLHICVNTGQTPHTVFWKCGVLLFSYFYMQRHQCEHLTSTVSASRNCSGLYLHWNDGGWGVVEGGEGRGGGGVAAPAGRRDQRYIVSCMLASRRLTTLLGSRRLPSSIFFFFFPALRQTIRFVQLILCFY